MDALCKLLIGKCLIQILTEDKDLGHSKNIVGVAKMLSIELGFIRSTWVLLRDVILNDLFATNG